MQHKANLKRSSCLSSEFSCSQSASFTKIKELSLTYNFTHNLLGWESDEFMPMFLSNLCFCLIHIDFFSKKLAEDLFKIDLVSHSTNEFSAAMNNYLQFVFINCIFFSFYERNMRESSDHKYLNRPKIYFL